MGERRGAESSVLGKTKEKEKEKERDEATSVYSIPKWRGAMHDLGISQPKFDRDCKADPIQGGFPIAEVFEVRVQSGRKNYSKIHGNVWIQCGGSGRLDLFKRPRLNPQIVHRKESLELTGPDKAIVAYDNIFIGFHLMEGRIHLVGMFLGWDSVYDALDVIYNDVYKGNRSSVTWQMSYVVYGEAVLGTIEVEFKSTCSVGIYGTITASNKMIPRWKAVLFCKEKNGDEYQSVESGEQQVLPLLRSVAAVPIHSVSIQDCKDVKDARNRAMDGRFLIDVNLMNIYDEGTIAKGVLEFPIENYGKYVGTFFSKYGEMQVKVSFDGLFIHFPESYKQSTKEMIL